MHVRCAALDGNLALVRREPEHHDPLDRLTYFAELLSGSIQPGQLRGLTRGGIEQQSRGGCGDPKVSLRGRLRNFSGFSGDAKCLWIKALRYQGPTPDPHEMSFSVSARRIDHFAFRRHDLDAVRRFAKGSGVSATVLGFSGLHTIQESSAPEHLWPPIG